MLLHYIKIAVRNLVKYKVYTLINIMGLAIGIAACMLIFVYIQDEISYDNFHEKGDRIFRITDEWTAGNVSEDLATVPFPVGKALQLENPDVIEKVVRLYRPSTWRFSTVISYEDKSFVEPEFMFADSTFFQIFSFDFVRGTQKSALEAPNSIVITKQIAQKYFGTENPIGKVVSLNNQLDLEVTGVLKNIPENSHIQFDFLTTIGALENWWNGNNFERNWIWQGSWTYLLLNNPRSVKILQSQLPDFVQRHFPESIKDGTKLTIQPLTDIYLYSQRYLEIKPNGNILYIYIFSAIALSILLIACINYMNLATARSASRAREVGMRKILGAYRVHLIRQFLGESLLFSFISVLMGVALLELALPLFNSLTDKSLDINYLQNWQVVVGLLVIGTFVGIFAGSYPALYLSGFRPLNVIKGVLSMSSKPKNTETTLRKALVVSQFVVSLGLLISISVIYNQLDYLQNKNLGFNKEQVLLIDMHGNIGQQYNAFKNEIVNNNNVLAVSRIGGSIPGLEDGIANSYKPEGSTSDQPNWIAVLSATHDIEKVLDLEFIKGRPFSTNFPTDSNEAVIINRAAVEEFGWQLDNAIGKRIDRISSSGNVLQSGTVVGIIKNFHFEPLREDMKSLVMRFGGGQIAVRLGKENISQSLAHIEKAWNKFAPEWPLNYHFMDDDFDQLYQKEKKLGDIIRYFTILAIFIACLGLYGLASFTAERRTKEIGVRKVLGASVSHLILLLSKDFTKLVAIAFILASPLAYWAMNKWLENFAYRISIELWVFLLAGAISLIIALLTVSFQAIKAALSNPVNSLRYE